MRVAWTLVGALVLSVALAAPAHAAKRDWKAEKAAKAAKQAVTTHCAVAEGEGEEAQAAADALRTARTDVGAVLEARGQLDLMYWRGVISQCLEDDGSALQDFNMFLLGQGDATRWRDLADDAAKRIADLETYEEPPEETTSLAAADPRIITIAGLGGSSLLTGILSGAAWGTAQQQAEILYAGGHVGNDLQAVLDAGDQASDGSRVLGVTSLITGLGAGAVALILFQPWERGAGVALVPTVVPTDRGVAFGLTGQW